MTITKQDLKQALTEILDDRESKEHQEEHEWIRERIKAEQDKRRMYRAFTRIFIRWSIPTLLTGILYWLQSGHWPKIEL